MNSVKGFTSSGGVRERRKRGRGAISRFPLRFVAFAKERKQAR
jgi:hypothetical protein